MVCTTCGHVGEPATITKGSFIIELALWLCFFWTVLVPLSYSLFRLFTKTKGCGKCGAATMIPEDSPVGRKFIADAGARPAPRTWDT